MPKALAPLEERWARTLAPDEAAALESVMASEERARERRLELYRRAAFGLATPLERASLAAVNGGRVRFGAAADG